MTAQELLAEAALRGIELYPAADAIRYRGPKSALADLKPKLAACKLQLLGLLRIEQARAEALTLLSRLKTFTVPAGRMPAAREIAERCASRLPPRRDGEPDDPASILDVLRDVERELIALGGAPEPELAEAVGAVEAVFPRARLVGFTRSRPRSNKPA